MNDIKRGGRWIAGQSGNPKGRTPGSGEIGRLRAAISESLPEIIQNLVVKAKEGDMQAARLLLERTLPPMKATEGMISLELPKGAGLSEQGAAIVQAVANGTIAPSQGAAMLTGLSSFGKLKEFDELEARITALEEGGKK